MWEKRIDFIALKNLVNLINEVSFYFNFFLINLITIHVRKTAIIDQKTMNIIGQ